MFIGQPVKITPGKDYTLRIDMGSLYPPAAFPWFDRMTPALARRLQRTLRVTLDGQVVLDRTADFYDATSRRPSIGTAGGRPGYNRPFSGRILARRTLTDSPPPAETIRYGPVQMVVTFPAFTSPRNEPLLSSGRTLRGDLIYIRYLDERHVRFGHDHWGAGATTSPPVEVDPQAAQTLEIDCSALYPAQPGPGWPGAIDRDRCIIRLDGRVVWDAPGEFYPVTPDEIGIGTNAIGASSAGPAFSGGIVRISRLPASLQAGP